MEGVKGTIALSKPIAEVLLSGCTYNTSLAMPAFLIEPPKSDVTTGIACVKAQKRGHVAFVFAGTDGEDEDCTYQVIGLIPVSRGGIGRGWLPLKIAEGTITLGARTLGAAGEFVEASASLVADKITKDDVCPLSRVYAPAADEAAYLLIDCSLFQYVYVQVKRGTCATIDVIAVAGDAIGGLAGGETEDNPGFTEVNTLIGATTTTDLVGTPGAGKQLWVYAFTTSFPTAAGTVTLKSDTVAKWGPMARAENGGDSVGWDAGPNAKPIFKCATNKALKITTAVATADCQIMLRYRTVDV